MIHSLKDWAFCSLNWMPEVLSKMSAFWLPRTPKISEHYRTLGITTLALTPEQVHSDRSCRVLNLYTGSPAIIQNSESSESPYWILTPAKCPNPWRASFQDLSQIPDVWAALNSSLSFQLSETSMLCLDSPFLCYKNRVAQGRKPKRSCDSPHGFPSQGSLSGTVCSSIQDNIFYTVL